MPLFYQLDLATATRLSDYISHGIRTYDDIGRRRALAPAIHVTIRCIENARALQIQDVSAFLENLGLSYRNSRVGPDKIVHSQVILYPHIR